jgi:predicted Ser/Thr protein kinase
MRVTVISRIKNHVYQAHLSTRGNSSTTTIAIKVARGLEEREYLEKEVGFYENQLLPLQGTIVPRIYGYFRGKMRGEDCGCLLMEYCTGSAPMNIRELQ